MDGPDYSLEEDALARGALTVAGIDEAGRGPLAGPVVAAAVRLVPARLPAGLNDSKLLTRERREALCTVLEAEAEIAIGIASVEEIDRVNILQAAHLAMCRAVSGLSPAPCVALVDGNMVPKALCCPGEAVIGGDGRALSIAAASIVAKVTRDRMMLALAEEHPGYGWETNAGYGTAAHLDALRRLGVTPHHRRSFAPVHNILYQEKSITS